MTVRPTPILLTPGPTPIPPEVQAAMAVPLPHHRTSEFKRSTARRSRSSRGVFRTEHDVLMFTASGTGGFESAYANLLSSGRSGAVRLGRQLRRSLDRDGEGLRRRGADAARAARRAARRRRGRRGDRGRSWPLARRRRAQRDLDRHDRRHPRDRRAHARPRRAARDRRRLEPRRRAARDRRVGPRRRRHRQPEGAHVPSRPRLRERLAARLGAGRAGHVAALLLRLEAHAQGPGRGPQSPFTPAITLVLGLDAALDMLLEDGLEASWARTEELGAMVRGRVRELGLELFSPDDPSLLPRDGDLGTRGRRRRRGQARPRRPPRHRGRGRPGLARGQDLAGRPVRRDHRRDLRSGLDALALELGRA